MARPKRSSNNKQVGVREEVADTVGDLVNQGKVRSFGLSEGGSANIRRAMPSIRFCAAAEYSAPLQWPPSAQVL
jgi:aryl-alcohol dehydrogenase-like predicted oxidoreductase